jgi:hypothetical protein
MSLPCLLPAPHASVVSRSWRSIPSWHTVWSTDSPIKSRTGIRQHSASLLDTVGDVNPRCGLSQLRVVSRRAYSLLGVRSLTPDSSFHIRSGWRLRGPLCWAYASAQGLMRVIGVGRVGISLLGSDEAEPALLGSGEVELPILGSDEVELAPPGSGEADPTPGVGRGRAYAPGIGWSRGHAP